MARVPSDPERVVSENGTAFTGTAILKWADRNRVAWHDIGRSKPQQDAVIKSVNGNLRHALLNRERHDSRPDARGKLAWWRYDDNHLRPHSALGHVPPAQTPDTARKDEITNRGPSS